jgi:glutamyl-Q tRNA(Asp) synthetase
VRQISLYQHFGWQAPDYVHLPLALNAEGNKL